MNVRYFAEANKRVASIQSGSVRIDLFELAAGGYATLESCAGSFAISKRDDEYAAMFLKHASGNGEEK